MTDGGFIEEVCPLVDQLGYENVLILHLYRENTSFEKDSRRYITLNKVKTVEIKNTEDQFISDIDQCIVPSIKEWMK